MPTRPARHQCGGQEHLNSRPCPVRCRVRCRVQQSIRTVTASALLCMYCCLRQTSTGGEPAARIEEPLRGHGPAPARPARWTWLAAEPMAAERASPAGPVRGDSLSARRAGKAETAHRGQASSWHVRPRCWCRAVEFTESPVHPSLASMASMAMCGRTRSAGAAVL